MFTICNEYISLTLDAQARLTAFENRKTGKGNIIARPVPIFRAVLKNGENWEDVVFAPKADLEITAENAENTCTGTICTRPCISGGKGK